MVETSPRRSCSFQALEFGDQKGIKWKGTRSTKGQGGPLLVINRVSYNPFLVALYMGSWGYNPVLRVVIPFIISKGPPCRGIDQIQNHR